MTNLCSCVRFFWPPKPPKLSCALKFFIEFYGQVENFILFWQVSNSKFSLGLTGLTSDLEEIDPFAPILFTKLKNCQLRRVIVGDFAVVGDIYYWVQPDLPQILRRWSTLFNFSSFSQFWAVPKKGFWCEWVLWRSLAFVEECSLPIRGNAHGLLLPPSVLWWHWF